MVSTLLRLRKVLQNSQGCEFYREFKMGKLIVFVIILGIILGLLIDDPAMEMCLEHHSRATCQHALH